MIYEVKKDLLTSEGIIAHQVNCKGVMGAGVAKQIKENLQYIRQEKKIIKRIKREEESYPFFYKPTGQANVQIQKDKKKEVKEKWQTTKSI